MATATSNKRKMYLTTAGVLAFGVAAYGLGRVYPPMGPSAGTIAPADRYQSAQIGDSDVTLGDTAVPELMQTDAFELMTKDPSFRALAASPGSCSASNRMAATPRRASVYVSAAPTTPAPITATAACGALDKRESGDSLARKGPMCAPYKRRRRRRKR